MRFRLRKFNDKRIFELRQRRELIREWLEEYDSSSNKKNHLESIVLAKIVLEHLNEYILAYESANLPAILNSAVKGFKTNPNGVPRVPAVLSFVSIKLITTD